MKISPAIYAGIAIVGSEGSWLKKQQEIRHYRYFINELTLWVLGFRRIINLLLRLSEIHSHLKPNGILGISLYILPPPRMELRLINTIVSAMEELGLKNVKEHVIAVRSWGSISILVKKSPLTLHEIGVLKEFSKNRRFDVIYYPGIRQEETNIYVKMPSNNYYMAFEKILSTSTRAKFINDYIFDINPVRDDYPFFNYYLKLKNVRETLKLMGKMAVFYRRRIYTPGNLYPGIIIKLSPYNSSNFFMLLIPLSKEGHRE
jgi:hypothetical protein